MSEPKFKVGDKVRVFSEVYEISRHDFEAATGEVLYGMHPVKGYGFRINVPESSLVPAPDPTRALLDDAMDLLHELVQSAEWGDHITSIDVSALNARYSALAGKEQS